MEILGLVCPRSGRADNAAKKTLDQIVTFAGSPLETFAIMNLDHSTTSCDQTLVLQFPGDGIDRRTLHAQQPGQRFLR